MNTFCRVGSTYKKSNTGGDQAVFLLFIWGSGGGGGYFPNDKDNLIFVSTNKHDV